MINPYLHNGYMYVPNSITNRGVGMYFLALGLVSLLFMTYTLALPWLVFGIVEVLLFFAFSNSLSRKWCYVSEKRFAKNVVITAFLIRVVYVGITFLFYLHMCGDAFGYEDADPTFYDEVARGTTEWVRNGKGFILEYLRIYHGLGKKGLQFSDCGYPIYLTIIYLLTNDSIFLSRIINCIWSALTVLLIYRLAKRHFGESIARISAIFCMLMPNLIYYCGTNLKEVEMVFLTILFTERADNLLSKGKFAISPTLGLVVIAFVMFTFRTVLAIVLILALLTALLLSSTRIISWGKRILISVIALLFIATMLWQNINIRNDVQSVAETGSSKQKANMEWRSTRKDASGNVQKFAKYASAAVFAPLIFTLPFPTMVEIAGQESQKMLHGGNFCKNVISYLTILSLFIFLFSGEWRKHVLPLAVLCGYLVILVFSTFAQSERFHQPILCLELMFAAYGINILNEKPKYKRWFVVWSIFVVVCAVAWNWFKLAGRDMI